MNSASYGLVVLIVEWSENYTGWVCWHAIVVSVWLRITFSKPLYIYLLKLYNYSITDDVDSCDIPIKDIPDLPWGTSGESEESKQKCSEQVAIEFIYKIMCTQNTGKLCQLFFFNIRDQHFETFF